MFVATDNQLAMAGDSTFNEFIIVGIFADRLCNALCFDEFSENGE